MSPRVRFPAIPSSNKFLWHRFLRGFRRQQFDLRMIELGKRQVDIDEGRILFSPDAGRYRG